MHDKTVYKSPIATCIPKRDKLKKIKIMHYKTIEERQNLNDINNLYYKYENDVNDNNFNQILFGNLRDKSSNSIRNYTISDDKTFITTTDNDFCKTYNDKNINYINFKRYNSTRKNSIFIKKNNINYNQINNKRNESISPNIYINKEKIFKRKNNTNIYEINSYRNIYNYY